MISPDFYIVTAVIIGYSVIQSMFGVGLLVFGTPTLLLLNYPFEKVLSILLPCSIIISFCQVFRKKDVAVFKELKKYFLFSIPTIAIGLLIILNSKNEINIKYYVGFILIFSALLRTNLKLKEHLSRFISKYSKFYLLVLGFIHGMTNSGGGLLSIYSLSIFKNKESVRTFIAFAYLFMAMSQVLILLFNNPSIFEIGNIFYILVSFVVYIAIGKWAYRKIEESAFASIFTGLIFLFGSILIAK